MPAADPRSSTRLMPSDTPDSARPADHLAGSLPAGTVFRPGTDQYATSTSPDNSSFRQRPDAVVRPRTTDDVAAAVSLARARGLRVAVQATGHGVGSPLGDGLVLVDTSALDAVSIDPAARTARVGAGVTWSKVQAQAERGSQARPTPDPGRRAHGPGPGLRLRARPGPARGPGNRFAVTRV
jgi:FAD/FMN-containing dehydrogenase